MYRPHSADFEFSTYSGGQSLSDCSLNAATQEWLSCAQKNHGV